MKLHQYHASNQCNFPLKEINPISTTINTLEAKGKRVNKIIHNNFLMGIQERQIGEKNVKMKIVKRK